MENRERIMEAALRLFAERGSRGATTRRIAEAAGVNEVTLFRHFGSKEALLREALTWSGGDAMEARLPEEPGDPRAELTRWCSAHLAGMYGGRLLLRATLAEVASRPEAREMACEAPRRVSAELERYLSRLQAIGLADADVEVRIAASVLLGAVFSDAMSRDLMPDRFAATTSAAAAEYVDFTLRALGFPLIEEDA